MLLRDLPDVTARVTVIPSVADKVLVQQKDGNFTAMSVQKFVAIMVDSMRREANRNA